jgi:hypothetical protein
MARIAFDLPKAGGIGDAVCGIYAASGLAAAGHAVVLSTKHHQWISGCQAKVGLGDFGTTGNDASIRYDEQLVAQRSDSMEMMNRAQWYLNNLEIKHPHLQGINPIVPEFRFPLEAAPIPGPYIVMNPFSAHSSRIWKQEKWKELASALVREGITPIGIGSMRDSRGLSAIFSTVKGARFYWAQTASWVRSAMRQSIGFIGNDSGMTHVAASLGVPTVAVMSHIRPSFVFNPARVTPVVPDPKMFPCIYCGWQTQQGYRYGRPCMPTCEALQSISVSAVFEAVRETCLNQKHSIAA